MKERAAMKPAEHDKRKYDGLSLEEKVDEALSILDSISYAFPDGPEAHRISHRDVANSLKAVEENTAELVALVKGVKGLRTLLVWAAPIMAAFGALWAWAKHQGTL